MTYDEFNEYCSSLPATSHVIQWGKAHVWKVGGKVFAIGGWEKRDGREKLDQPAFTFKASAHNFDILQEQPGFRPAPYMASRGMKWIQQYDAPAATDETLRYYLQESHRMVSLGLTKKLQKELGLNQN